uniref:Reverse transcriptase domain-containing protein n=1 Tax=Parastrongyloides trichosuri TaxID=131310 RepID=A0A0N4ZD45_PARTI
MIKSCMLAISSVISFIEKSREKDRLKAFNRLKTYSALVKATIKSLQKNKKDRSNKDAARIRKINKRLRLNMGELKSYLIELDMRLTNDVEAKNDTFKLSKIYRQFDNRPSLNTVLPRSSNPVEVPLDIEVAHQFYENLYKKVDEPASLPIIDEFFEEVSKSFKNLNFEKPSRSDLEEMVVSSANFLTSGPDGIPGKFLVRLNEGKKLLLDFIEEARNGNLELITEELCEGTTVLLPKTTDINKLTKPEFYRPITTLNHIYKLLTSTYHRTIIGAIDNSILAPCSQKALKRGSRGCTDALLKDVAISLDNMYRLGKSSRKNLEVGWIDLKKAFDSSFRSFTHRLVDVLPLPQSAKNTLRKITTCWNSKIRINKDFSANYKIERGLPQGDALSPLLYCMLTAVVPYAINKMHPLRTNLPHISSISIYMDDTKLYANDPKELRDKLLLTKKICNNLGLEFNNSKSATFGDEINPDELEAFPRLKDSESYKYLGIEQKFITDLSITESTLINATLEFMRKVNKLQIPTRMIARLMCNTLAPKILYVASHTFFKGKTSQIITLGEKLAKCSL